MYVPRITITAIGILLVSFVSFGRQRNFSPWIIIKDKPLMSYVEPIITSGAGDHISLFVDPEKYENREWNAFIRNCHQGGISTVYLTVGGSEKNFDTPEARKQTVDEWIEKAEKYAFDGIDMDIENLSPEVKEAHIIFVKYAAGRLHEKGLKLAMAVGFYPPMVKKPFVWWYDPAIIGTYCDNIRVMIYDQYWAGGKMNPQLADRADSYGIGPTCSYPFAVEALDFWMKFVPVEKLTINIPAYSNVYSVEPQNNEAVKDAYSGSGQSYYPRPQDIDRSRPVHKYWSWIDRIWVYVYHSSDPGGRLKMFFASDEDSTGHLLQLLEKKGITSVGMWYYQGKQMDPQWDKVNEEVLNWSSTKDRK